MNEFTGLTSSGSQPHAEKSTFPHGAGNIPDVNPLSPGFTIRTIAKPGDKVFLIRNNKVRSWTVRAIRVHITPTKTSVFDIRIELALDEHDDGDSDWYYQNDCFSTKEELLASL